MDYDDNIISLSPGFRFDPTEEELISFYLHKKIQGQHADAVDAVIPVLYIYGYNPWDLPQLSGEVCRADPQLEEWFFFIPKQEKEAKGGRPNRLTTSGYWKATGSPSYVYSSSNQPIGVKRTMIFYHGRARNRTHGSKTEWKMNEYGATDHLDQLSLSRNSFPSLKGDFTICRIYKKTKCLRAFDRRPAGAPSMDRPSLAHQIQADQYNYNQPTTSCRNHQIEFPSTRTSRSNESSSSLANETAANNKNIDPSEANNEHGHDNSMEIDLLFDQAPFLEWGDALISNWTFEDLGFLA